MHEPLLDRIHMLEKANRRWKLLSVALGLLLAASVATGATFTTILQLRVISSEEAALQAMDQAMEAMEQEERAHAQHEQARVTLQQSQRALEAARQRANQDEQHIPGEKEKP